MVGQVLDLPAGNTRLPHWAGREPAPRRRQDWRRGTRECVRHDAPVIYDRVRSLLPAPLARYVMHFEAEIERAVADFAQSLPHGARVLDAGAGEGNYKPHFAAQRYTGLYHEVGNA